MRAIFCFLLFATGLFSFHLHGAKPQKIRIGFIPSTSSAEELRRSSLNFEALVQEDLGIPVEIYIAKDYRSLSQAMQEKRVDFAFFTALSFVQAEKQAKAKVLLKKVWENRDYYFSALVVPETSKIGQLAELKDKKIAFVDTSSTSGYLYPRVALQNVGLLASGSSFQQEFSGNHKQAILDLVAGKVDAAAVFAADAEAKTGAWTLLFSKNPHRLRSLWVSKSIPSDPFCVRQDFYEQYSKTAHDLMFFLKELSTQKAEKSPLKELLDVDSFELATSKQYEPVREMAKKLGLSL